MFITLLAARQTAIAATGPDTLDGNATVLPILQQAAGAPNYYNTFAFGTVVANDSTASYLVTLLEAWALERLRVGRPAPNGRFGLTVPTLLARDETSGLTLLSVPRLPVRSATFQRSIKQGDAASARWLQCFGDKGSDGDVACNAMSESGIISAVHDAPPSIDFSAGGDNRGGGYPILDDRTKSIVGIASNVRVERASGAYLGIPAATIDDFAKKYGLQLAFAAGGASGQHPGDKILAAVLPSLVRITSGQYAGSGVVVGAKGGVIYILTAAHVIKTGKGADVLLPGVARARYATVLKSDLKVDLALLSVESGSAPALKLAAAAERGLAIGVVGYPTASYAFRENGDTVRPKLTEGLIGLIDLGNGRMQYTALTDEGNSGGPIIEMSSGKLVGIVQGEPGTGTFVGVPLVTIRRFLKGVPGIAQ
jgi:hypothetical protein